MENTNNNIRKELVRKPIVCTRVYKSDFQKKGMLTAELRQEVVVNSFYPSQSVNNSLTDSLFAASEFNIAEQKFSNTEIRVTWLDVPEGTTDKDVQERLDSLPQANIKKILSNHPILTQEQSRAINSPDISLTLEDVANRQVVRYPKGHDQEGRIILDSNGKPQYLRRAFTTSEEFEDIDDRTPEADDFYATREIEAEMTGSHSMSNVQTL